MSGRVATRRVTLSLLALVVMLFGVLVPATTASAYDEDTIVQLTNEARWSNGQAGLLRNGDLDAVALAWAQHMASTGVMEHNPDVTAQVPAGWRAVGENVSEGYSSGSSVHEAWMESPGHRANILGDYTDIGVALYDGGNSVWGVQVFAKYPGHVGPGAPAPAPAPAPPVEPAPAPAPVAPPVVETPPPTVTPTPTPTPSATTTTRRAPTATPSPVPTSDSGPLSVPLVLAGVFLLLAAAVIAGWWLLRRRRRRESGWKPRGRRRSLDT